MKIYVACLASYNNGVLHGKWIDASSDVDEMQDEINSVLRASPYPNVTVTCPECDGEGKPWGFGDSVCEVCKGKGDVPSAEEWAIHDYDDMPTTFGEYTSLQTIADFVELTETYDWLDYDAIKALVDYTDDAADMLEDNLVGHFETFKDYAYELADEMMSARDCTDDFLKRYFNYEAWARDLEMDYTVIDTKTGVLIFHA